MNTSLTDDNGDVEEESSREPTQKYADASILATKEGMRSDDPSKVYRVEDLVIQPSNV